MIAPYLRHVGVLATIEERVRFARRRFGHYELIDFVVVLLGSTEIGVRAATERVETTLVKETKRPRFPLSSILYSWAHMRSVCCQRR